MKTRSLSPSWLFPLLLAGLLAGSTGALGADAGSAQKAELKLGGLLYDNWPKIKGFSSPTSHPLYPADSKKEGTSTWRCKECHGWDYVGREGRYRSGSHYTGIAGVWQARGKSTDELLGSLTDTAASHDFGGQLNAAELRALVRFLREGLLDPTQTFGSDGTPLGSAARGEPLYRVQCSRCHGNDGKGLDFEGKKEGAQGVGWLARKNPQETLHKIRWGHPGSKMPSAATEGGLSAGDSVDLLSYAATLPE